jgi:hypothetical protein
MPDRRILVPILLVALLSGCSTDDGSLRLTETKSPVQLLRNEAWFRLPEVMVKGDSETTDVSLPCDESGLSRSWMSRTTALINNSFAPRTVGVAEELVESFRAQGWDVEAATEAAATEYTLEKAGSIAVIDIVATEKTDEHRASISISITGPCVATGGADSDEVRLLEGRS